MQDVRGVSAVPPEAPSEAEAPGRVNGTEGSEPKMTRTSPLRVIYGAHYPRGCVFWPEFSLDRYTYDGGWDI